MICRSHSPISIVNTMRHNTRRFTTVYPPARYWVKWLKPCAQRQVHRQWWWSGSTITRKAS
ncbi:Uncharacterised protein [Vibrio cholerae]|nr:Uncharacterised protein [Vibrio cholerae]